MRKYPKVWSLCLNFRVITAKFSSVRKFSDFTVFVDESSQYLMKNHKELLSHYSLMYDNMMKINTTVSHLLSTVNTMQDNLDDRINWFSHLLNVAGNVHVLL